MSLPKKIFLRTLFSITLISFVFSVGFQLSSNSLADKAYAHSPSWNASTGWDELQACLSANPDHQIDFETAADGTQYFTCKHPEDTSFMGVRDPLKGRFSSLGQIASEILPYVLLLGGMIAFLFLLWAGFKYMTAQGDPKAVSEARGTIVSATIGLIILASIFVILQIVEFVFKIEILGRLTHSAYAQGIDIGEMFKFGDQGVIDVFPDLGTLVTNVVNIALTLGGLLFFGMLLWGGMRYMLSRGDDKMISDARQTITNATIGLLIIVSSFVIIKLIALATGADISIF
jgi:TRAP-type C4-dicarboxylate transport system permease small subunit